MMIYILTIIAVALPILGMLHYVYTHDHIKPEPKRVLFLTFLAGVVGGILSFFISKWIEIADVYTVHPQYYLDYFYTLLEAIPDECLKLLALYLAISFNGYFDEYVDGIVYAVCISLGFVFVENVIHLCFYTEHWYDISVFRSFFILPGSLACGIFMGYYYSRIHFKPFVRPVHWLLVLGIPIACHALCNTIVLLYDRMDEVNMFWQYVIMFILTGCTLAILFFVHRLIFKQLFRDLRSNAKDKSVLQTKSDK